MGVQISHTMVRVADDGTQRGSVVDYNADFVRNFKQERTFSAFGVPNDSGVNKQTTYYIGKDYEKIIETDGTVKHRYTISTGGGTVQIERLDGSLKDQPKYMLADNLGSTNVILNALGEVEQRLEFDPWGMRVAGAQVGVVNSITNKGYTGHEMDDEVGLVNMNARVYDPYLGRFLSADTVLPDPSNLQSFNRYSYVRNNPLKYTDPTGNIEELIVTAPQPDGSGRGNDGSGPVGFAGGTGGNGDSGGGGNGSANNNASSSQENAEEEALLEEVVVVGQRLEDNSRRARDAFTSLVRNTSGSARSQDFLLRRINRLLGVIENDVALFLGLEDALNRPENALPHSPLPGIFFAGGQLRALGIDSNGNHVDQSGVNWTLSDSGVWQPGGNAGFSCIACFLVPAARAAFSLARGAAALIPRGSYSLYIGEDAVTGVVRYVGITGRAPSVRIAEHLASNTPRNSLLYRTVGSRSSTLLRIRIREQLAINRHGLGKNGGTLLNRINSIAPGKQAQYGIR